MRRSIADADVADTDADEAVGMVTTRRGSSGATSGGDVTRRARAATRRAEVDDEEEDDDDDREAYDTHDALEATSESTDECGGATMTTTSTSLTSFARRHARRYEGRIVEGDDASAGPSLASIDTLSNFSNWLKEKAAETDQRARVKSKIISLESFCMTLVLTAVVTRSFFQCDLTMIALSCAATAWVFKTRDSSPTFALAANTFFMFVQLIYCEPIHSFVSTDGLSCAERFYGVAVTPAFRAVSSHVGSSVLTALLWGISVCREREHEALLDGASTMIVHNLLRFSIILWDTSETTLSIEKAFNGFVVTFTLLYMGLVVMVNEGFRMRDLPIVIASRVRVRWAGAFEVVMALVLHLSLYTSNESVRGSSKWYLYMCVCIMLIPATSQHGRVMKFKIVGVISGVLRVFVLPIKSWTPIRTAHAVSVLVNHIDVTPAHFVI